MATEFLELCGGLRCLCCAAIKAVQSEPDGSAVVQFTDGSLEHFRGEDADIIRKWAKLRHPADIAAEKAEAKRKEDEKAEHDRLKAEKAAHKAEEKAHHKEG